MNNFLLKKKSEHKKKSFLTFFLLNFFYFSIKFLNIVCHNWTLKVLLILIRMNCKV